MQRALHGLEPVLITMNGKLLDDDAQLNEFVGQSRHKPVTGATAAAEQHDSPAESEVPDTARHTH